MINLLLPTWCDLASVAQPAFAMAASFFVACSFLALRGVE